MEVKEICKKYHDIYKKKRKKDVYTHHHYLGSYMSHP